jgi:hypothetical protein
MSLTFLIIFLFVSVCFRSFGQLSRRPSASNPEARAARLKRIQNASWWIQLLMVFCIVMGSYSLLAFFMGWPFFSQPVVRIVISQNHIYTSPQEMPGNILGWWLVQMALAVFCWWVIFSLFGLYRRGILFSAKNVRLIRMLGYYLIANWVIDDQLQSALKDENLSMNPVFIGLLIIFVSWIMDEGRKIQEEQELTV